MGKYLDKMIPRPLRLPDSQLLDSSRHANRYHPINHRAMLTAAAESTQRPVNTASKPVFPGSIA
jgi:hypothetical protein